MRTTVLALSMLSLLAGASHAQIAVDKYMEPESTAELGCETRDLKTGQLKGGVPVFFSNGLLNGGEHKHIEFGRPIGHVSPTQSVSNTQGVAFLEVSTSEFTGPFEVKCATAIFISRFVIYVKSNAVKTKLAFMPTGFSWPVDCRHAADCRPAYFLRPVTNNVSAILQKLWFEYSGARVAMTAGGLEEGGAYDPNQFSPWSTSDPHKKGNEADFKVEGMPMYKFVAFMESNGCVVRTTGIDTAHVEFPALGFRLPPRR